jgi:hypothetical protein
MQPTVIYFMTSTSKSVVHGYVFKFQKDNCFKNRRKKKETSAQKRIETATAYVHE